MLSNVRIAREWGCNSHGVNTHCKIILRKDINQVIWRFYVKIEWIKSSDSWYDGSTRNTVESIATKRRLIFINANCVSKHHELSHILRVSIHFHLYWRGHIRERRRNQRRSITWYLSSYDESRLARRSGHRRVEYVVYQSWSNCRFVLTFVQIICRVCFILDYIAITYESDYCRGWRTGDWLCMTGDWLCITTCWYLCGER